MRLSYNMNIGYLAFIFAGLCGLVSLIGAVIPGSNARPTEPTTDYTNIYRALSPKEI